MPTILQAPILTFEVRSRLQGSRQDHPWHWDRPEAQKPAACLSNFHNRKKGIEHNNIIELSNMTPFPVSTGTYVCTVQLCERTNGQQFRVEVLKKETQ
jgi:hypothetical protein